MIILIGFSNYHLIVQNLWPTMHKNEMNDLMKLDEVQLYVIYCNILYIDSDTNILGTVIKIYLIAVVANEFMVFHGGSVCHIFS